MASEREAIKQDLERTFKPIFEEHREAGGIPLRVLRRKLNDYGVTEHIPASKVEMLIQRADADEDGHLDYEEFVYLVTETSNRLVDSKQLSKFQKLIRASVTSVVPRDTKNTQGDYVVDDYLAHYTCKPPPLFMITASIVEIIVFIVYAIELSNAGKPVSANSGVPLYSPFIYNPSRRYEAWRYLGYMLLHSGYLHLIFNLIFQLLIGIPLEMVHKWWRMGIVYLLGVIAGSLCHTVFDTHTMLAGASGGCYALIGAHFAIVIMNWKEMTKDWLSGFIRFITSAPVRLFIWTLLAACDIGMAIYKRYTNPEGQNIGYAAHFGGALAGLLIGIPVLKNIDEKPWEKVVVWISLIIYLVLVIFAVCWNAFYPGFPATDWRPCCPYPKYS